MSHYFKLILIILLVFINGLSPTFAQSLPSPKFITLADIHFDPFIGCGKLPHPCPLLNELRTANPQTWNSIFQKYTDDITTHYHQDTDYLLLKSTLTELNHLNQQQAPAFILVLGDFLAHNFPEKYKKYSSDNTMTGYQAFVKKTFQYLTQQLTQAAPKTPIYPILGNNDSYDGNYDVDPNGLFLHDTANLFATLIQNKKEQEKFQHEFPHGGYYAVTLAKKNQRLIVLNSVLFSALHSTPAIQKAAAAQLTWLQVQLNIAKQQQQNVLLALHIPPGIDIYLSVRMRFAMVHYLWHPLFWQTSYNEKFLSLLQRYSPILTGIVSAHIHSDAFQLIPNKSLKTFIPISLVPSISPLYDNNPGLKIFSYNPQTLQLINFVTYFYPLSEEKAAKWQQEYDFNAVYQPHCKQCLLVNGMLQLTKDNILVDSYKKYYAVSRNAQPITTQNAWLPYYWCGIYHADWESYKACE